MLRPISGLQQPYSSAPSPSASSSRSKIIVDAGSVSDSGITTRATRSSRYLGVSLACKGPLSPLDLRHPSPSSPNLSLPGYLSDGCTFERSPSSLHPSHLDVKRLLSKPAALSVLSTVSISSDPGSHALPRSAPYSSETWPSKTRVQTSPSLVIGSPTISKSESPQPEQSRVTPPLPLQQRPRNLLRKKSTSSQTRAVMSATPPSDKSILSPSQSSTHPPAAVPSRNRRSTALQNLSRSRAAIPASAPPSGSGRLTPAGAIIQAYKEQDNRREALAAAASVEKLSPIIPLSASWLDTFQHHTSERNIAPAVGGAPCDSGLDRSPDSFVMVDSPQGTFRRTGEHSPCDPGSGAHSSSPNASQPIRSLTRKVSARFRRGLAAVSGAGAQSGRGHDDGEGEQIKRVRSNVDGLYRRERQLSLGPLKAKRKPEMLRLSIDSPLPSSGLVDSLDERLGRTTQGESVPNTPNTLTQGKGKKKEQENVDISTGTKLWRLVKRISTGALRERSQTPSAAPPPVPAISKELPPLPPRTTFEMQVPSKSTGGVEGANASDCGKGVMNNCIDSNLSPSGVSSYSYSEASPPAAYVPPRNRASLPGLNVGEHPRRPSLSSSPPSSEPTSTHFFRSHSSRSSFSSIICHSPPPPPVPIPTLARSPSPRTHLRTKNGSSSSPRGTSHDESRSSSSLHTRTRGTSTPDIPTFSVSEAVNNFILRRPSLTRHHRHHAPSRSMIFPRSAENISGAPLRRTGSEVRRPTRQHAHVNHGLAVGSSGQNRDSHGSDTTVRRLSMSTAAVSAGANTGSSATFRELGSERQQAWTSQEKEEKWRALLERSARAGGTLHLGAGSSQLPSDNIRFSSSTLSSSETLPVS